MGRAEMREVALKWSGRQFMRSENVETQQKATENLNGDWLEKAWRVKGARQMSSVN